MKKVVVALTAVVLACGVSYGQERTKPNENLKCFRPFIGTWIYDGLLLEDVPDIAKKGAGLTFQKSFKWILDKNAVELSINIESGGVAVYSEKTLIGWDGGDQKIVYGGVSADGLVFLGSTSAEGKELIFESSGTTAKGGDVSYKGVVGKTDKDTLTWKAIQRTGGIVEGPSPVYSFKRVNRVRKPKQPESPKKPKQPVRLKQAK